MTLSPPRNGHTWIKICGITSPTMAEAAAEAGVDAIGIVLVPESPRYVADRAMIDSIRAAAGTVPVFAVCRPPVPTHLHIAGVIDAGDVVQVHGSQADDLLHANAGRVVRAIRFDETTVIQHADRTDLQALLIDGPDAGSGVPFDHAALAALMPSITPPVILAGGLRIETVAETIATVRPFGVDVSSGVESSRGVKDVAMMRDFVAAASEPPSSQP